MLAIIFLATKNAIGSALTLLSLARYALNKPLKAGLCGYKIVPHGGVVTMKLKRDGVCNPVPNVLRVAELSNIEGCSRFMLS